MVLKQIQSKPPNTSGYLYNFSSTFLLPYSLLDNKHLTNQLRNPLNQMNFYDFTVLDTFTSHNNDLLLAAIER